MASTLSEELFEICLKNAICSFNLTNLKREQISCVNILGLDKRDTLAILPTGYGESLVHQETINPSFYLLIPAKVAENNPIAGISPIFQRMYGFTYH